MEGYIHMLALAVKLLYGRPRTGYRGINKKKMKKKI